MRPGTAVYLVLDPTPGRRSWLPAVVHRTHRRTADVWVDLLSGGRELIRVPVGLLRRQSDRVRIRASTETPKQHGRTI